MTTEVILSISWGLTLLIAAVLLGFQARKIGQLQDLVKDLKAESKRRMDLLVKSDGIIDAKNAQIQDQHYTIECLEDAIARLGIGEEPEEVPPQAREG